MRRLIPENIEIPEEISKYKIPQNWIVISTGKLLQLGVMIDLQDGNHGEVHPVKKEFVKEGTPFLTASEVKFNKIDFNRSNKLSQIIIDRLRIGFAKKDDVILTHKASVGKVAITDRDCILSPQTTYYRVNSAVINNKYLMYYMASHFFQNQLDKVKSQTTRDYVSLTKQYKFFCILAPMEEQKRIVSKIEELFSKIDSAKQSLEQIKVKLKNYRISFLKSVFEVKESELLLGWSYVKLENIVKTEKNAIKRGPFGSHIKKSFFVKKGYKVYEQQHAINNDFTLGKYYITKQKFQELKSFEIKRDDIIISCSGTIGKLAVVPENFQPGIINQALLKISIDDGIMDIQLFKYLFEFWMLKAEVESHGSGMGNLSSVKALKEIPILLAPKEQQQKMISQIEQGFSLIENTSQIVESTLQKLQTMKMSILKRAFEGKLVPQDPKDEPSSVLLERIKAEKS